MKNIIVCAGLLFFSPVSYAAATGPTFDIASVEGVISTVVVALVGIGAAVWLLGGARMGITWIKGLLR